MSERIAFKCGWEHSDQVFTMAKTTLALKKELLLFPFWLKSIPKDVALELASNALGTEPSAHLLQRQLKRIKVAHQGPFFYLKSAPVLRQFKRSLPLLVSPNPGSPWGILLATMELYIEPRTGRICANVVSGKNAAFPPGL